MELNYKGHVDHLPGSLPEDSSFFYRRRDVAASTKDIFNDFFENCMCAIPTDVIWTRDVDTGDALRGVWG